MKGFIELTVLEEKNIYGGFAFAALFTMVIQAIIEIASAIKLLTTDSGSVKLNNIGEAKWNKDKHVSEKNVTNPVYYIN